MMAQVIAWFGWGNGIGALAGISVILTILVLLTPVIAGYILYGFERLQVTLLGKVNRNFAYFFVNYATFPGTFIHEMSHAVFAAITGAKVTEICMFESSNGRLGHIRYHNRGPFFMHAVQDTLTAVAPTVVGFSLGYFLLQYIFGSHHTLLANIGLWYLVISLVDHSTMSDADMKNYFHGSWLFAILFFVLFLVLGLLA